MNRVLVDMAGSAKDSTHPNKSELQNDLMSDLIEPNYRSHPWKVEFFDFTRPSLLYGRIMFKAKTEAEQFTSASGLFVLPSHPGDRECGYASLQGSLRPLQRIRWVGNPQVGCLTPWPKDRSGLFGPPPLEG